MVHEAMPRGIGGKGDAIGTFMRDAGVAAAQAVYFGDDATDENAFRALVPQGGIGVLVGTERESFAQYRVEGPTSPTFSRISPPRSRYPLPFHSDVSAKRAAEESRSQQARGTPNRQRPPTIDCDCDAPASHPEDHGRLRSERCRKRTYRDSSATRFAHASE
jgi:hypothetical protein